MPPSPHYELAPLADEGILAADVLYILGRVAREYPEAASISIGVFIGDEPLFDWFHLAGLDNEALRAAVEQLENGIRRCYPG